MIITNNKIVIEKNNDEAMLLEALGTVKEYLLNNNMGEIEFTKVEDLEFPAYHLPEGITYKELERALGSEVFLKAINEDNFVYSYDTIKQYKHDFTPEELREIAEEVMLKKEQIRQKQAEKAFLAKKIAAEIEQLQEEEDKLCHQYVAKYDYKDAICRVVYDFEAKQKMYIENSTSALIEVLPMEKKDIDLQIKHRMEQLPMEMAVEVKKKKKGEDFTFVENLLDNNDNQEELPM